MEHPLIKTFDPLNQSKNFEESKGANPQDELDLEDMDENPCSISATIDMTRDEETNSFTL